jgi:hypothetical protein
MARLQRDCPSLVRLSNMAARLLAIIVQRVWVLGAKDALLHHKHLAEHGLGFGILALAVDCVGQVHSRAQRVRVLGA